MVANSDDPEAYANAVAGLLEDDARYGMLVSGCRESRSVYTLEAMVQRFAHGIVDVLAV